MRGALIWRWKGALDDHETEAFPGKGKGKRPTEQQRILEHESENRWLRMEREILKKPRPSLPRKTQGVAIHRCAAEGQANHPPV
ncbi:MAG: hypothetical protein O2999_14985 [Nitrospirae bacterium]|nr:hypothetical protein [Nitrospirota bacterium]MDA1305565.1 hypothetical protein [Nitrospirota bacterium]